MTAPGEKLFIGVARLLAHQPVNDVIPVLITASARALVDCGEGDVAKLEEDYNKFCEMLRDQMTEMTLADKVTRQ